jgi:hypothetical protein
MSRTYGTVSTTPTTPASTPNTGASVMSMPQAGSGRLLNAVTALCATLGAR